MTEIPQFRRVAAYAVVLRADRILLCRLAERISAVELWTLPGGGLEHGEHPRDALRREIYEETGLEATVGEAARIYSLHQPDSWQAGVQVDAHRLRIVYEAWVPLDSPQPRVVEVDGSTSDAAWVPLAAVVDGSWPVAPMVLEALAEHEPVRRQRVAAYALVEQAGALLLTRISDRGHHVGAWTLPGGGLDHGESPADAVVREVAEETGLACRVGDLLGVHDVRFTGVAPSGRTEDFHGVHLVYAATVAAGAQPAVAQAGGTSDAVGWVPVAAIETGEVPVHDLVLFALRRHPR